MSKEVQPKYEAPKQPIVPVTVEASALEAEKKLGNTVGKIPPALQDEPTVLAAAGLKKPRKPRGNPAVVDELIDNLDADQKPLVEAPNILTPEQQKLLAKRQEKTREQKTPDIAEYCLNPDNYFDNTIKDGISKVKIKGDFAEMLGHEELARIPLADVVVSRIKTGEIKEGTSLILLDDDGRQIGVGHYSLMAGGDVYFNGKPVSLADIGSYQIVDENTPLPQTAATRSAASGGYTRGSSGAPSMSSSAGPSRHPSSSAGGSVEVKDAGKLPIALPSVKSKAANPFDQETSETQGGRFFMRAGQISSSIINRSPKNSYTQRVLADRPTLEKTDPNRLDRLVNSYYDGLMSLVRKGWQPDSSAIINDCTQKPGILMAFYRDSAGKITDCYIAQSGSGPEKYRGSTRSGTTDRPSGTPPGTFILKPRRGTVKGPEGAKIGRSDQGKGSSDLQFVLDGIDNGSEPGTVDNRNTEGRGILLHAAFYGMDKNSLGCITTTNADNPFISGIVLANGDKPTLFYSVTSPPKPASPESRIS